MYVGSLTIGVALSEMCFQLWTDAGGVHVSYVVGWIALHSDLLVCCGFT